MWYDEVEDIDPKKYLSPNDYIRPLRVFPLDRWSSVQTEESYDTFYKEEEYIGLGLSLTQTSQKEIYVRFVYKDSPADRAGFKRSDKILEINRQNYETITIWVSSTEIEIGFSSNSVALPLASLTFGCRKVTNK